MKLEYDRFVCSGCGNRLKYISISDAKIESDNAQKLECESCNISIPIINRIPRFVSSDNYASSFGYQWNTHRETQLDSYTGLPLSRERLFSVSTWPSNLRGESILEAGSGAGRFTEVLLSTGAEIYSFDYSNAVDANMKNNGTADNLHLYQGDIYKIPFAEASFDKVLCLGVLQHTPNPENAFKCLAQQVKPGGSLVIDSYRKHIIYLLQWKYILRPITTRLNQKYLYRVIEIVAPRLVTTSAFLRKLLGPLGARLIPILQYSHWGLSPEINNKWAILDTFDMYSPAHDHPQTLKTVEKWFLQAGFEDIVVQPGPNGIIGRGIKKKNCKVPTNSK